MALQSLPSETLSEIFSYLSTPDLISISSVSHEMHAVSEPVLYRKIELWTDSSRFSRLTLLLQILLSPGREALARQIRSLSWSDQGYEFNTPPSSITEQPPSRAIENLTAAALRLGIDPPTSDLTQVILLLHLLPCLQYLTVFPPDDRGLFDEFMERLSPLQPVATLPLGLQSLRSFHWGAITEYCGVSPKLLLTIMGLPRIQKIHVTVYSSFARYLDPSSAATIKPSTVTHLTLPPSAIPSSALTSILKAPRALEHLTYYVNGHTEPNLLHIGAALKPLQNSLQYLYLEIGSTRYRSGTQAPSYTNLYHDEDTGNSQLRSDTIGSLRLWPVLWTVRCTLMALLGKGREAQTPQLAYILPAGIQELEILYDRYWTIDEAVDEVLGLLMHKEEMVKDLKRIAVCIDRRMRPELEERLKAACTAASVELVETEEIYFTSSSF
ncbi:hypothetical protein Q9L58_006990 [Maublancomyces gigas]|uniref:F-box domain-containing protein n=1 Tax=Discina gigas TaxID=1032678 RepID=A0ABR3GE40_9PEZI